MKDQELFERFREKLTGVSGECYVAAPGELVPLIQKIFAEKQIGSVSIYESPIMKEVGLVKALEDGGCTVHTDHIRKNAETDKAGITEFQYGIAELGTLVQTQQDADGRIASTLVDIQIALLKSSQILADLDAMVDMLAGLPEIPSFVGFVTGPSRTADIECVSTVGVHGPLELVAIVVDDE